MPGHHGHGHGGGRGFRGGYGYPVYPYPVYDVLLEPSWDDADPLMRRVVNPRIGSENGRERMR
jgi:hypothetical protein